MNWEGFVKKYVWDNDRTPYTTRVPNLTRVQADNELFFYAIFLAVLFTLVAVVSATKYTDTGINTHLYSALFGTTVALAGVLMSLIKWLPAGLISQIAPIGAALYVYFGGLRADLPQMDKYFLIGFCGLWLLYGFRVIAILKRYPDMPEKTPPAT